MEIKSGNKISVGGKHPNYPIENKSYHIQQRDNKDNSNKELPLRRPNQNDSKALPIPDPLALIYDGNDTLASTYQKNLVNIINKLQEEQNKFRDENIETALKNESYSEQNYTQRALALFRKGIGACLVPLGFNSIKSGDNFKGLTLLLTGVSYTADTFNPNRQKSTIEKSIQYLAPLCAFSTFSSLKDNMTDVQKYLCDIGIYINQTRGIDINSSTRSSEEIYEKLKSTNGQYQRIREQTQDSLAFFADITEESQNNILRAITGEMQAIRLTINQQNRN